MIITGVGAGEQILLSNLSISPVSLFPPGAAGFDISACAGDVVFEDCSVVTGVFLNLAYTMTVSDCTNVVFRGCELFTADHPLEVANSHVLLTTTTLYQLVGPNNYLSPPGILLTNSTATVIGSVVRGGQGPQGPAPGAVLYNSTLRLGPYALLQGTWRCCTAPAQDSHLLVDPRATLTGLLFQIQAVTERTDATYHSWIIANRPYAVSVAGPPGGFGLMLFGEMAPPAPTPFGQVNMVPSTAIVVDLVYLPQPSGWYEWSLFCPSGAPSGFAFTFQALTLSATGQFGVSVPSPALVAWEPGVIP
jgi:hypothetical protein